VRVNIISYEPLGGWVLADYAERLAAHLTPFVREVVVTSGQRPEYDVTFHVNYWGLRQLQVSGLHCTMVTHVDTPEKYALIKAQAEAGAWGFCFSSETARMMTDLTGVPRFAGFAPPAMIEAPARTVSVLVAARSYPDGRKNEHWVTDFVRQFPPAIMRLRIIGAGWEPHIKELELSGYQVEYCDNFDRERYHQLLKTSDYLLVAGFDEGALSTLDAILYDVVPIVTAQGYHLEQSGEMLTFVTHDQLLRIARKILGSIEELDAMSRSMTDWGAFAEKHYLRWKALLPAESGSA
jgi:hypothetical protein